MKVRIIILKISRRGSENKRTALRREAHHGSSLPVVDVTGLPTDSRR